MISRPDQPLRAGIDIYSAKFCKFCHEILGISDKRLTQKKQQGSNSSECWPCFCFNGRCSLESRSSLSMLLTPIIMIKFEFCFCVSERLSEDCEKVQHKQVLVRCRFQIYSSSISQNLHRCRLKQIGGRDNLSPSRKTAKFFIQRSDPLRF